MEWWSAVDGHINLLAGNPFDGDGRDLDVAMEWAYERLVEPRAWFEALLADRSDVAASRIPRLLFAAGHFAALRSTIREEEAMKAFLSEPSVPADVWRKASRGGRLPITKERVFNILDAADRVYELLQLRFSGASSAMRAVRRQTWRMCFGPALHRTEELTTVLRRTNVLVLGESGTGKDAVARAIQCGRLEHHSLVPPDSSSLNVAALPSDLAESELFGHVEGAFTGSKGARPGMFRANNNGTIFLDEIGDLAPTVQPKLLRAIEVRRVRPVGGEKEFEADVRCVCATSKPMEQMVHDGTFREDLFYRLAGWIIRVPPLRERPEDIAPIAEAFLSQLEAQHSEYADDVREWAQSSAARSRQWRGNARALHRAVRAILLGGKPAPEDDAPSERSGSTTPTVPEKIVAGDATLAEVERWFVSRVAASSDSHAHAARRLGIDRGTLARKLREAAS